MKKTFAELKRDLQVGVKVKQLKNGFGYPVIPGAREITIAQTNAIAMKTTRTNGEVVNSWLYFPASAKLVDYEGNRFTFYTENGKAFEYEIVK